MKKLFICLTALFITNSYAQQTVKENPPAPLTAYMWTHKIIEEQQKEKYIDVKQIQLDDIVQYTIDYTNNSDKTVSNVQVGFKIPVNMMFVNSNLTPIPVRAQNIKNKWLPFPLIDSTNGKNQPAHQSEYQAFQWSIPNLEPGKKFRITLRAKLYQRPTFNSVK